MDALLFHIQPASPQPIYRQIAEQVRRMVAGGQLGAGDPLPSVRAFATAHAVNPMTVSKAYSLLESEGVLERLRGIGMAVAATTRRVQPIEQRIALIETALDALARLKSLLEKDPS